MKDAMLNAMNHPPGVTVSDPHDQVLEERGLRSADHTGISLHL
jgi:hypothetical protein